MTIHSTSNWSENLQQQTRQAIAQQLVTPDGHLHFKHPTLGYAYAFIDDLERDCLVLRSKTRSDEHRFAKVEALLHAGWALD